MKKHFPKLIDIPYMPLYIRMVDLHHPPYKQAIRKDLGKDSGTFHCCSIYRNASSTHAVCKCLCHHRLRFGTECFFFTCRKRTGPVKEFCTYRSRTHCRYQDSPFLQFCCQSLMKTQYICFEASIYTESRLCTERSCRSQIDNPAAFRQIWQAGFPVILVSAVQFRSTMPHCSFRSMSLTLPIFPYPAAFTSILTSACPALQFSLQFFENIVSLHIPVEDPDRDLYLFLQTFQTVCPSCHYP